MTDRVYIHDPHATIIGLLGMDPAKLTYHHGAPRYSYRLTDAPGNLARGTLA